MKRTLLLLWLMLFALTGQGCAHKNAQAVMWAHPIPEVQEPVHKPIEPVVGDVTGPYVLRAGQCATGDGILLPPVWVLQAKQVKADGVYWRSAYLAGLAARQNERWTAEEYVIAIKRDAKSKHARNVIVSGLIGGAAGVVAWEIAR